MKEKILILLAFMLVSVAGLSEVDQQENMPSTPSSPTSENSVKPSNTNTKIFPSEDKLSMEMVAAHNSARAKVSVGKIQWSPKLSETSFKWADELANRNDCRMVHSQNDDIGENIYWGSPTIWSDGRREARQVSPSHVVQSWESENVDYHYETNSCNPGKMCGHYTQVVWSSTTKVGCGYALCPDKSQIWVCQYAPPGNYVGVTPY